MRIDKRGNQRTLEEDILEIWGLHGWDVIEERVSGNTWEITAKAKSSKDWRIQAVQEANSNKKVNKKTLEGLKEYRQSISKS